MGNQFHIILLSFLTFPGVIFHELSHYIMCKIARIRVHKVVLFRFGDPLGYVEHDAPEMFIDSILVSIAPFILNSTLAYFVFRWGLEMTGVAKILTFWLGISIALHSFPSSGDADQIWNYAKNHFFSIWTPIALPIIILIKVVDKLKVVWLDLAYAVALMLFAIK